MMFGNDTTSATARDGYEAFDCARAVALIAFVGLLSNFQDIIDEFTNNAKKRRRRRSDNGEAPSPHLPQHFPLADLLSGVQWEDTFRPTLKTLQWEADGRQGSQEEDTTGEDVANINSVVDDEVEDTARKRSDAESNNAVEDNDENYIIQHVKEENEPSSDVGRKSSLLNDLAHIGPRLAMWLVDTGDGRVSSEDGHAGVCRATQTLTKNHGWVGSIAANLLTSTLTAALAKHEPARLLLQDAELAGGAVTCHESFKP